MAIRAFRRLRELLDVDVSGAVDEDALIYDAGTDTWIPGAVASSGGTAETTTFTPAGNLAASNVQDALEELDDEKAALSHVHDGGDITTGTVADARIASTIARDSEVAAAYQPLDSDLTAIAALTTTAFGRALLELANQAALLSAAGAAAASHAHAGEDITSGTVADARIASTIARDSEVTAAVAAEATARDSAISTAIANLVASAPGVLDTLDEIAAALGDDPNFAATMTTALAGKQPLDSDLTAIAALSTTAYGRSLLEAANAAALRTLAGLVIGTDVPAIGTQIIAGSGLAGGGTLAADRTLDVNVDASTIEISSDTLRVKDSGITSAKIADGTIVNADVSGTAAIAYAKLALAGSIVAADLSDAELAALAGLTSAADRLPYFTGSGTASLATFTSAARSLVDDADAAAMLTTLGLSTFVKTLMDDADASTFLSTLGVSTFIKTLLDDTDAATARSTLGAGAAYRGVACYGGADPSTSYPGAVQPMTGEYWDTDSYHSTVTNNSRITIPSGLGGKYLIWGTIEWGSSATNTTRRLYVRVNGSSVLGVGSAGAESTGDAAQNFTLHYPLSAGDYIELLAFVGTTHTGIYSAGFGCDYLGP